MCYGESLRILWLMKDFFWCFSQSSLTIECILRCFVEAHFVLRSYKVSQIGNKGINKKGEINVMEHLLFVSLRDCFFLDTFQMKVELFDCWFLF